MAGQHATVLTPEFLAKIERHPNLPLHSWYFIAATVLCVLNRPEDIRHVYLHAIGHKPRDDGAMPAWEEQLYISRRMREALLKTAAVGGMPKTINAMSSLKAVTPDHLTDGPLDFSTTSRSGDVFYVSCSQILQRGRSFFNNIYGKVAKRVMEQMNACGTPDLSLTAQLTYGYLLSNTDILSPAETSFVMISGLVPQDVNPQLKGHLKGALNGGATVDEVMTVRNVSIEICQAYGMRMLREDEPCGWGWRSEVVSL